MISSALEKCLVCNSTELSYLTEEGGRILRCKRCGLVHRFFEGDEKKYFNEVVGDYTKVTVGVKVDDSRDKLFREFLDKIDGNRQAGDRILDVGCGRGFFLYLAKSKGWAASGVEITPNLAKKGIEEYGVDIKCSTFEAADLPADHFNVVTMWNVLDYLWNPMESISNVKTILKPGGLFFIRTPNAFFHTFIFKVSKLLKKINCDKILPRQSFLFHRLTFSNRTLRLLLEKNGFESVSIKNSPPTSGDPYNVKKRVKALKLLSYFASQVICFISFGKLTTSPSIEVFAKRA